MRTYRDGSLTLTSASATLVGVGTLFVANVSIGDIIVVENGQCFEVVAVPDDTHLTVDTPAKATGSFGYAALRFVTAVNFRDLSIKIEQFLTDRQANLAEFTAWMTGTKTGGPTSNGYYPMTDRYGTTRMYACPELLAFGYVDAIAQAQAAAASATASAGSATASAGSATASANSATASDTSAQASAGSATAAAGSASAANTSKNAAAASATAASTSETNALASKNAAATSATNAGTSETNANSSKNAAAASATAADGSKTAAAGSATAAANSATAADGSKTAAAGSASAASTSATNAATSETNANASKNAAATSATNAATSETNAGNSATAAAGSATTATNKATAAAQSATDAAASAAAAAVSAGDSMKLTGGTMTGPINEAPVQALAAGATVNLATSTSNTVTVAGSATITSFGTLPAGSIRRVIFLSALSVTHNATSLILPGAANITTAVGDMAELVSNGSGNWRCYAYNRAGNAPLLATTSSTDVTAGRTLKTGDLGLGGAITITDAANANINGAIYRLASPFTGGPTAAPYIIQAYKYDNEITQIAFSEGNSTTIPWVRQGAGGTTWSAWGKMITTLDLTASSVDSTVGQVTKVGDFGIGDVAIDLAAVNVLDTSRGTGFYQFRSDCTSLPVATTAFLATVIKRNNAGAIEVFIYGSTSTGDLWFNRYIAGAWLGWKQVVTGVASIAQGGTGATTAPAAATALNLGAANYPNFAGLELSAAAPYIDFHFGSSAADYTTRLIATSATTMSLSSTLAVTGQVTATSNIVAATGFYAGTSNHGQLGVDGNIYGSVWGNNWLSNVVLTSSNFRTYLSGIRAGDLGSYALAIYAPNSAVGTNTGVVGSSLIYTSSQGGNAGATLPGNWYCAGYIASQLQNTLWQRYV